MPSAEGGLSKISTERVILRQPLLIAQGYLLLTVLLYILGPTAFQKVNLWFVLPLLMGYQIALSLGYNMKIGSARHSLAPDRIASHGAVLRRVRIATLVGLGSATLALFTYTEIASISPVSLWESVQESLSNPSQAYANSFEMEHASGPVYSFLVLLAPISWSATALAIAYFKEIGWFYRLASIGMIALEAIRWIALGRNKGVFDIGLIVATVLFIKYLQRRYQSLQVRGPSKSSRRGLMRVAIIGITILIVLLAYFTNAVSTRGSGLQNQAMNGGQFLLGITPTWMHETIVYMTSYLTQGYYALSYAYAVPWQPTFGIGHSYFVMLNVEEIIGGTIFSTTYQARLSEFGIDPFVNWHTMYLWAANDLHWLGVLPLMVAVGWFFALVVEMAVVHRSAISYPLACLMSIFVVYIPANNQVFSTPITFAAFWGLVLYILLCKVGVLRVGPLVLPDLQDERLARQRRSTTQNPPLRSGRGVSNRPRSSMQGVIHE